MKINAFEKIIRKVVREEIDHALRREINETAMSPTPEQMFNANDPVSQFVNKDWSPVMKAIEKKKEFRP